MKILSEYKLNNDSKYSVDYCKSGEIQNYNNKDYDIIICCRATAREIYKYNFPNLKLIQLNSAGFENIPLDKYKEKNIYLCNAGTTYSICMSETILFGILQVEKRLRKNPNNRKFKLFRKYNEIGELFGKKAITLGAGNIATCVADRLKAFGVEVDGYDPYCAEKPQFGKIYRNREELLNNLNNYDYIVSTLPDTADTKFFINNEFLSKAKKQATLVNVGRIACINKQDLYISLKNGLISYAVLDMFEKIPNPVTNKFRRLKNAIILPGVSAISKESRQRLKDLFDFNISKIESGEKPRNIVNGLN